MHSTSYPVLSPINKKESWEMQWIPEISMCINLELKTNQNDETRLENWIVQSWDDKNRELITVFKDEEFLQKKDD